MRRPATCATRWASRTETVRALNNGYADILNVLARITKDAKERAGATGLRKTWIITSSSCVSLCGSVF